MVSGSLIVLSQFDNPANKSGIPSATARAGQAHHLCASTACILENEPAEEGHVWWHASVAHICNAHRAKEASILLTARNPWVWSTTESQWCQRRIQRAIRYPYLKLSGFSARNWYFKRPLTRPLGHLKLRVNVVATAWCANAAKTLLRVAAKKSCYRRYVLASKLDLAIRFCLTPSICEASSSESEAKQSKRMRKGRKLSKRAIVEPTWPKHRVHGEKLTWQPHPGDTTQESRQTGPFVR